LCITAECALPVIWQNTVYQHFVKVYQSCQQPFVTAVVLFLVQAWKYFGFVANEDLGQATIFRGKLTCAKTALEIFELIGIEFQENFMQFMN